MKFCPYCGADLIDSAVSFCAECGKPLKSARKPAEKNNKEKIKRQKSKMPKENSLNEDVHPEQDTNSNQGYDGYYDDILPADEKIEQQGLDKTVIKNLIIIAVGVIVAIGACVTAMYLM